MNKFIDSGNFPLVLNVPGLYNSGPNHWQSLWEQDCDDVRRVELGMWDRPHRNSWVNQISLAVRRADKPVVLAAHSLGCMAVVWWAAMERPDWTDKVVGALLVAPPEVDLASTDSRIQAFGPTPKSSLPFPSIMVASRNDPYMLFERSRRLAAFWGSTFVDVGEAGHINGDSGLGKWEYGWELLNVLSRGRAERQDLASFHNRTSVWSPVSPDIML